MNQKIILCATALVAFLSSCNKESVQEFKAEGKTLTLEVGVPTAPEDSTKIYIDLNAGEKTDVLWTSGDAFRLCTCLPGSEYSYDATAKKILPDNIVTDCGNFTTTQDQVKKASFTGSIPAGAKSETDGIALYPANGFVSGSQIVSGTTRLYVRVRTTIPAEQDGTGVQYLRAVARFKDGTLGNFQFLTTMMKIKLAEDTGTTKITLTKANETTEKGLVGKMNAYFYFGDTNHTSSKQEMQNTLVVQRDANNDGVYDELSGDIYFVTRSISKNVKLTLKFENADGKSKSYSITTNSSFEIGKLNDYSNNPFEPSFK